MKTCVPLLTVGAGPSQHSFVDYLRAECIPPWQAQFSQLEVFHWMVEWATRPYYSPRGAIYEARLHGSHADQRAASGGDSTSASGCITGMAICSS